VVSEAATPGSEGFSAFASSEGDRKLLKAITTLREQIDMQPGLDLDVTGLLNTLGGKLEQAHSVLAARGRDPQTWERSVWALGAIKIIIIQVKVVQWTEMLCDNHKNLYLF
jgi:hypothetical protein